MARALLVVSVLLPLIATFCNGYELIPPGPKEVFKSGGGSLQRWGPSETLEKWAGVGVVELTMEPGGFLLPRYLNAASIGYVLEGSARARVVTPFGPTNLPRLKQGDVVAIPEGYVMGLHNDGSEKFRVLGVADAAAAHAEGLKNITASHHLYVPKLDFHLISGQNTDWKIKSSVRSTLSLKWP
ncbi:hypothetical protein KFL_003230230, partial [Klebsormidium nitens]